jgi:hypothetical protein
MTKRVTLHAFVVDPRPTEAESVEFRVIASAGYRAGLIPEDPEVAAAAAFAAGPGTEAAVYAASGGDDPASWERFADVVPLPAEDGTPLLRFRASRGGVLPAAFRAVARSVRRIVLADVIGDSGEGSRMAFLFTTRG